jgi:transcription elongation factor Elf1
MKLCVKKSYCPRCQKLVTCHEQKTDSQAQVVCSRCGQLLWVWNGIHWRYVRESV